jgi:hypothetical protein
MFDIGPTGEFPEGKLGEHDDGEITIAVSSRSGNVIVEFGSLISWLGLSPAQARELGEALIRRANACEYLEERVEGRENT